PGALPLVGLVDLVDRNGPAACLALVHIRLAKNIAAMRAMATVRALPACAGGGFRQSMDRMPARIDETFKTLRKEGKGAFIAYICAGDPDIETSLEIVRSLEEAGADLIELGLPFSDPVADGVVIQNAAHRALTAGTRTEDVIKLIERIREVSEIPLVLFTYLNPVYAYGFQDFHAAAAAAGADGVLILDLPPDEAMRNRELQDAAGLEQIHLIAPTTPAERIELITRDGGGFIYYVSREGVTGARASLQQGIARKVELIRASTPLPIVVGFGISTPEQAREVSSMADGVVVGSAIVSILEKHGQDEDLARRVHDFVKPLVEALKGV
ncbi:MAG: tryptophan synthase subunit alpha, partial [Verrucomicrobiales bacterium]